MGVNLIASRAKVDFEFPTTPLGPPKPDCCCEGLLSTRETTLESHLPKLDVAGSTPVSRSNFSTT